MLEARAKKRHCAAEIGFDLHRSYQEVLSEAHCAV